jgi:hypothetical protein
MKSTGTLSVPVLFCSRLIVRCGVPFAAYVPEYSGAGDPSDQCETGMKNRAHGSWNIPL